MHQVRYRILDKTSLEMLKKLNSKKNIFVFKMEVIHTSKII